MRRRIGVAHIVISSPDLQRISLHRNSDDNYFKPRFVEDTNILDLPLGTTARLEVLVDKAVIQVLATYQHNKGPKNPAVILISAGGEIKGKYKKGTFQFSMIGGRNSLLDPFKEDEVVLSGLRIHRIADPS